jgi:hypothetical protein
LLSLQLYLLLLSPLISPSLLLAQS